MSASENEVVACGACGAKNRIPGGRPLEKARCGRCGKPLSDRKAERPAETAYKLRCAACGAKNRVSAGKAREGAQCGRCKARLPVEALFLPQPVVVTDENLDTLVKGSPLPVLLFCWAPWCPTCTATLPAIEAFAAEARGKIRVGKLNVDQAPRVASEFNIMSVPYIFVFDNGEVKESLLGGLRKHELMMKMGAYL